MKDKIAHIIELLITNNVPVTTQEALLNQLQEISAVDLDSIHTELEQLQSLRDNYLEQAAHWVRTCANISERIASVVKIEQQLLEAELEAEIKSNLRTA